MPHGHIVDAPLPINIPFLLKEKTEERRWRGRSKRKRSPQGRK
jgi:hypothetical protein